MDQRNNTNVQAPAWGALIGGAAAPITQIALYYLNQVVPADIYQPVTLLATTLIGAGCAALGAFVAGRISPPK